MKTSKLKKNPAINVPYFLVVFAFLMSIYSCNSNKKTEDTNSNSETTITNDSAASDIIQEPQSIKPSGPEPKWGAGIKPEMQAVMEKLERFNTPPLSTLSGKEARMQPTPTDAVIAIMKENNIPMPPSNVDTTGKDIPVQGGNIHLRIYTPKSGQGPFPVIVYYHGGGWVIANLDTYDASAKGMAQQVEAIVVSVAYRLAPEHKFPTAHNDSFAAYEWVLKNVASLKGNAKLVAVVGESAGGNLAASVSMMAKQKKVMVPLHQVLIYPIAGYDLNTPSYQKYDSAKPLNKSMMKWFFDQYLKNPSEGKNKMISLVNAPDLKSMPPTTIIQAEIDPLESDGQMLGDKLKKAGVKVSIKKYDGVTHEFFGMATLVPQAKEAQAYAAEELKKALK